MPTIESTYRHTRRDVFGSLAVTTVENSIVRESDDRAARRAMSDSREAGSASRYNRLVERKQFVTDLMPPTRGSTMRIDLVTVPYRYDEPGEGLGAGPDALLAAGLLESLRAAGRDVAGPHQACLDPAAREEGRTAPNIGRLGADTARLVSGSRRHGHGALVLAGDDTAAIGVVSGLQQADGAGTPIGVVWVDAHGDFNTPETSFSGILAGMPVAILAGSGRPSLARGRRPRRPDPDRSHRARGHARSRREGDGASAVDGSPRRPRR